MTIFFELTRKKEELNDPTDLIHDLNELKKWEGFNSEEEQVIVKLINSLEGCIPIREHTKSMLDKINDVSATEEQELLILRKMFDIFELKDKKLRKFFEDKDYDPYALINSYRQRGRRFKRENKLEYKNLTKLIDNKKTSINEENSSLVDLKFNNNNSIQQPNNPELKQFYIKSKEDNFSFNFNCNYFLLVVLALLSIVSIFYIFRRNKKELRNKNDEEKVDLIE